MAEKPEQVLPKQRRAAVMYGTRLPLTYRPPWIKKLVPAIRSSIRRMPPPKSTGNESKASTAVVNQAQQVKGIRMRDIPLVRMLSSVVMKFSAPSNEPTQKI